MVKQKSLIPVERIEKTILLIRGQRVMLDHDLAELYDVETKYLKRQVRRNIDRFPEDFIFKLTKEEQQVLRSHFGTLNQGNTLNTCPMLLRNKGVAMLSSVLRSKRAVQVNIEIMRAFVRLRQMLISNKELARRLDELERKYDEQFSVVFEAIRQLMEPPEKSKRRIGFKPKN